MFEYLIFSSFTIGRVCRNKLHEKLAGITRLHRTYLFYMGNQLFVIYISRRCDINFVILSLVYIVLFGLKNKLLVELFAGTKPRKLYVNINIRLKPRKLYKLFGKREYLYRLPY